jgi:hypothetical protein
MGGRTAVDLIDEFLLGLAEGRTEGAESWRRAVDIVSAEAPDIAAEPRIRTDADTALPDGRHPIFWAGYILVEPGTAADDAAPGGAPPQVVR